MLPLNSLSSVGREIPALPAKETYIKSKTFYAAKKMLHKRFFHIVILS